MRQHDNTKIMDIMITLRTPELRYDYFKLAREIRLWGLTPPINKCKTIIKLFMYSFKAVEKLFKIFTQETVVDATRKSFNIDVNNLIPTDIIEWEHYRGHLDHATVLHRSIRRFSK